TLLGVLGVLSLQTRDFWRRLRPWANRNTQSGDRISPLFSEEKEKERRKSPKYPFLLSSKNFFISFLASSRSRGRLRTGLSRVAEIKRTQSMAFSSFIFLPGGEKRTNVCNLARARYQREITEQKGIATATFSAGEYFRLWSR